MFAISTKAKVAAGVAAGALMLGAAGAYAASANNTVTVTTPVTPTALPSNGPILISVNGKMLTTPLPSFANHGACVSFFAKNRNFALAPNGAVAGTPLTGKVTVSKNFHGKLVSGLQSWCDSQVKTTSTTSTTTDTTQSNDTQSGPPQGHGHGKPAFATD